MLILSISVRKEAVNLLWLEVWAKGGEGGLALAEKVLNTLENRPTDFHVLYENEASLKDKIGTIASPDIRSGRRDIPPAALKALKRMEEMGFGNLPVCMAKPSIPCRMIRQSWDGLQASEINVRDAYVCAGAGFVVVLTGSIMTMPGLPKKPAAEGLM